MSKGLCRILLVVTENYPNLKADAQAFVTCRRSSKAPRIAVTVARNRYIDAVQTYNVHVRSFPANLTAKMFGYSVKPSFAVDDEKAISDAPKVDFGNSSTNSSSGGK